MAPPLSRLPRWMITVAVVLGAILGAAAILGATAYFGFRSERPLRVAENDYAHLVTASDLAPLRARHIVESSATRISKSRNRDGRLLLDYSYAPHGDPDFRISCRLVEAPNDDVGANRAWQAEAARLRQRLRPFVLRPVDKSDSTQSPTDEGTLSAPREAHVAVAKDSSATGYVHVCRSGQRIFICVVVGVAPEEVALISDEVARCASSLPSPTPTP